MLHGPSVLASSPVFGTAGTHTVAGYVPGTPDCTGYDTVLQTQLLFSNFFCFYGPFVFVLFLDSFLLRIKMLGIPFKLFCRITRTRTRVQVT